MPVIERVVTGKLPFMADPSPTNLSAQTYAARLSDAMKAILDRHYTVAPELLVGLKALRKNIRIRATENGVLIEPKGAGRVPVAEIPIEDYLITTTADMPVANAIALLLHHRLILQPCKLFGLSDDQITTLGSNYDINLQKLPDGSVILT